MDFIKDMLPRWTDTTPDTPFSLERVHRTLAPAKPNQHRPVLIRFLKFQEKELVFRSTRRWEITYDGNRLYFSEDFSAETMRQCREFNNVRKLFADKGMYHEKFYFQNKRGIWCPRCAARVVKEGQCSGRKGPGKGRSPAAARAPLSGPEHEGRQLLSAASSSFGPRHLRGLYGPASWPVSRVTCAAVAPSTLPSWTHEDTSVHAWGRDRSPEERRTRHITVAVMRLHSLQVCASSHAARPGCFSAPPLSHTHSRREPGEGRRIRDGEMLIIRGEATDSSQYIYIYI